MSGQKRKKDINQTGNGGEFAARTHADADTTLNADPSPFRLVPAEAEPLPVGSVVKHLDRFGRITSANDHGKVWMACANGDEELVPVAETEVQQCSAGYLSDQSTRLSQIRKITDSMQHFKPHECLDMAIVAAAVNDGAWGDMRSVATRALINANESEDADLWLVDNADLTYEAGFQRRRGPGVESDAYFAALGAASVTARALAARHLIGKVPGWTQEGYDHLTRPWRTCWGPIHEADELTPASWAKRPLDDDDVHQLSFLLRPKVTNYAAGAKLAAELEGQR